jgi:hypothetical protein
MRLLPRIGLGIAAAMAAACLAYAPPARAFSVTLQSGNGLQGQPDALVKRLNCPNPCGSGFSTPFTAADFTAADAGPPAIVLSFIHGAWGQTLPCNPSSKWIGNDPGATPISALYAIDFDLPDPCCLSSANLGMCWMADDITGDSVNPAGVYLNGFPLPISGGNYATQTTQGGVNVLPYLKCGKNTVYVYNRDLACTVSGINFLIGISGEECVVPAGKATWGSVKAVYR